jgi:hypothetical protein
MHLHQNEKSLYRSAAKLFTFLAVCGFLATSVGCWAQVYVSPDGSDASSGTKAHPVQTLERARDLARTQGTRQVLLADGVYRLHEPLQLSPSDSGMRFSAMGSARPVISGSVRVTGWTQVDASRHIWKASVPASLRDSRQLYVNGVRALRTRGLVPVGLQMTANGYVATDATMSHWRNPSGIEFVYTGGNAVWNEPSEGLGSWTEPRCPIAAIHDTTIVMAQPCWDNSTERVMLPSGVRTANLVGPKSVGKEPSYVENAFELLGKPGQWYLDRPSKTIYYVPRDDEDMRSADVEVPVLETLVKITGTSAAPAHDITFYGIAFAYATWLGPNSPEGFSEIQANYQVTGKDGYSKQGLCTLVPEGACPYGAWTKTPGNVEVEFAREIHFANDVFVHLGAAGLDLSEGTQHSVVEACVFTDISGNGVQLGGVSAPLAPVAEFTSDNNIANNLFRNVGAEYHGGIAIVVGYARNTRIAHNELDQLPYAGISIGWGGWPDKIKLPGQANNSTNNRIEDNLIHDFMLVLSDGGGIYTQGRTGKDLSDGEKVTGNVIYNQYSSGHGIYTDNGSAMITISRNVVFHTNHDNINSRHRDYYDGQNGENFDPLIYADNWWQQGDADSDKEQVLVHGNRIIAALADAPAEVINNAGLQSEFRHAVMHAYAEVVHPAAPEPPSRVAVFGMGNFAYVSWAPPVFDGGTPAVSYTVTASNGRTMTIDAEKFQQQAYLRFDGLTPGQSYSFSVKAVNAKGSSVASLPSRSIIAAAHKLEKSGPPAAASAWIDGNRASIHFQTPASTLPKEDQLPIVAYAITILPSNRKVLLTGRNVITLEDGRHVTFGVVDGLTPGEAYRFSVSAVNAAGEGEEVTVPGLPVAHIPN